MNGDNPLMKIGCKLWKSGYICEAKEMIAICNCHYRFLNIRALEMFLMRLTIYLENWKSEGKAFCERSREIRMADRRCSAILH